MDTTNSSIQKLFTIANMLTVRTNGGKRGEKIYIRCNGNQVAATCLTDIKAGFAIALLTDKNNWYLTGEAVTTENTSNKKIIEYRKTTQSKAKLGKVKVLFYVEKEANIEFYIGGYAKTPKLIHTVPILEINNQDIEAFIHNYGNKHIFTVKYTKPIIFGESVETIVIQGKVKYNKDELEVTDYNYYFFIVPAIISYTAPRYKGNLIWQNGETIAQIITPTTNAEQLHVSYPDETLINYSGTYTAVQLVTGGSTDYTYNNFNVTLNNADFISSSMIGEDSKTEYHFFVENIDNRFVETINTSKKINYYLPSSLASLEMEGNQISGYSNSIKSISANGSKLLLSWKDVYIKNSININYEEYIFPNAPKLLDIDLSYQLIIGEATLNLNSNNLSGLIVSENPIVITEETTEIVIFLSTFTVDKFNISFIDTIEFVNVPIIFAKKENSFTWYCKGVISDINVEGSVTISNTDQQYASFSSNFISGTINVNIESIIKVPYVSFATNNGSLLINNGSIHSLISTTKSDFFGTIPEGGINKPLLPSNLHVLEDFNQLLFDCFVSFSPYQDDANPTNPQFLEYINGGVSDLISKSTYKNKTIYLANVLQGVKTKNDTAYIESWIIDDNGNFKRQDKIIKEKVYSLKNSTANILSVSYYP